MGIKNMHIKITLQEFSNLLSKNKKAQLKALKKMVDIGYKLEIEDDDMGCNVCGRPTIVCKCD